MSWGRIDDTAPLHPKQLRAGPEACWLWVCGCAWHGRNRNAGGLIPKDVLVSLYPSGHWTTTRIQSLAKRLVEVGLWHDEGDHYRIHDIEQYDGSQAPKTPAERAKAYRQRHAASRDERDEPRDDQRDAERDASRDGEGDESRGVTSSRAAARPRAGAGPVPSRPVPAQGESAPLGDHDETTTRWSARSVLATWAESWGQHTASLTSERLPSPAAEQLSAWCAEQAERDGVTPAEVLSVVLREHWADPWWTAKQQRPPMLTYVAKNAGALLDSAQRRARGGGPS